MSQKIVLASTSVFRRQLLEKLHLPFEVASPQVDELHLPGETPAEIVERLALAKARAAGDAPNSLVIGSDQAACIDDQILGKPGNFENALAQLKLASGKAVTFYTGLALLNTSTGQAHTHFETFNVYFRNLDEASITRYLLKEEPYQCAGSFKSEGYGICLFERLEGDDPNSLIGLPLIQLVRMLANEGIELP